MKNRMPSLRDRADDAYQNAYYEVIGNMNRADRRTAKGKLLEAKAKIAALEAENKILREESEI